MAASITYRETLDLVYVKFKGTITVDLIKKSLLEALACSKKNNCCYFLFDNIDAILNASLIDEHQFAMHFQKINGISFEHIFAILHDPETYPKSRAFFIEIVFRNWGNPMVRYFTEESKAREWLSTLKAYRKKPAD